MYEGLKIVFQEYGDFFGKFCAPFFIHLLDKLHKNVGQNIPWIFLIPWQGTVDSDKEHCRDKSKYELFMANFPFKWIDWLLLWFRNNENNFKADNYLNSRRFRSSRYISSARFCDCRLTICAENSDREWMAEENKRFFLKLQNNFKVDLNICNVQQWT